MQELPTCTPAQAGLSTPALERLRRVLQAEVERGRLPGAVALVARRGRIAWFESLGRLGPDAATPMTRDAIFRIYSMTKPIVSLAILMLMEEGRLLLSDPVSRYLPEFAESLLGVAGGAELELRKPQREATLYDLLRHTAGLTYEFMGDGPIQRRYAQARIASLDRSNREFARVLAALPLYSEPGSQWDYSRATDVLGAVVEVISGQSLGEFLQQRILVPLGMKDTGFSVPADQQHRLAEPFAKDPDNGAAVRLLKVRSAPRHEAGGNGLVSTAADYARFLQMMSRGGELDGVRLLGPRTIAFMTADHLGNVPHRGDLLAPGHGFGLGFAVRTHSGLSSVPGSIGLYFWGGIAGTSFFVDPKEELFALLLLQAPGQRDYFAPLYRNLVYASLDA
jgi:CubicO group peptidase (beta-lactamase class C family)